MSGGSNVGATVARAFSRSRSLVPALSRVREKIYARYSKIEDISLEDYLSTNYFETAFSHLIEASRSSFLAWEICKSIHVNRRMGILCNDLFDLLHLIYNIPPIELSNFCKSLQNDELKSVLGDENVRLIISHANRIFPRFEEARHSIVHAHDRNFGYAGFGRHRSKVGSFDKSIGLFGQMIGFDLERVAIELVDHVGEEFLFFLNPLGFDDLYAEIEKVL